MQSGARRRPSRRKLLVEALENRRVMATFQGNVFVDTNLSGTREAGENLLSGATVKIFVDVNNNSTRDATEPSLDVSTGSYILSAPTLGAGSYALRIDPNGTPFESTGLGFVNVLDVEALTNVPDVGVYRLGEIRANKFNDHNADGTRQSTDEGLAGVNFTLVNLGDDQLPGGGDDGPAVTVATDALGNFVFPNLSQGTYQLAEAANPTLKITTAAFSNFVINASGQLFVPVSGATADAFQSQVVVSALRRGNFRLGEIQGYTFVDVNGNGVDNFDPTVTSGVTLTLRGAGPDSAFGTADDLTPVVVVPNATTGRFGFDNLDFGRYQVVVALPSGVIQKTNALAVFSINDSGLIYAPTTTFVIPDARQLPPVARPELAVGLFRTAEIRGHKFNDHNSDGTKQSTDEGISGVRFTLTNLGADGAVGGGDDGAPVVVATGATGDFAFLNLAVGTYQLTEEANANISTTTAAFTNFVVNASGQLFVPNATTGVPDAYQTRVLRPELRRGNFRLGEIYGYVFLDRNSNGVDNTETRGMSDVSVLLTWAGPDNNFATTADNTTRLLTPDALTGVFSATQLAFGRYQLQEQLPTDVVRTTNPLGTYSINDSGILIVANSTLATPDARQLPLDIKTDLALGLFRQGEIHGYAFVDSNDNGADNSESRATRGITILLTWAGPDNSFANSADNTTQTITVNATTGRFSALQLRFGLYLLQEQLPANVVRTTSLLGTYNVNNSGVLYSATSTLVTPDIRQTQQVRSELALGVFRLGFIRGYAFGDKFGDGVDSGTEPRDTTATVQVQLFKNGDAAFLQTVTASAAGNIDFADLRGGTYRAVVSAIGPDRKLTTTRVVDSLVIVSGKVIEAQAGLVAPLDFYQTSQPDSRLAVGTATKAVIKGIVYLDRDGNGIRGAAGQEPGMAGFTITLVGAGLDGAFGTADDLTFAELTTSSTGLYEFKVDARNPSSALTATPDIVPGNFRVTITEPLHYTRAASSTSRGTETRLISGVRLNDILLGTGLTSTLTPAADQTVVTVPSLNFGVQRFVGIQGMAINDLDADGVKYAGEAVLANQTIRITGAAASFTPRQTITDAAGLFFFDDLPADTYTISPVLNSTTANGVVQETQGRTKVYAVVVASLNNIYAAPTLDPRLPFEKADSSTPPVERIVLVTTDKLEQGIIQLSKLEGSIYLDANANGRRDAGELGQVGVQVGTRRVVKEYQQDELATERILATDSTGKYTFYVWPGTYDVAEVKISSFEPTAVLPVVASPSADASRQRFTDYGLVEAGTIAKPRWTTAAALDPDGIDNDLIVVYEYFDLNDPSGDGGIKVFKNVGTASQTTTKISLGPNSRPSFAAVVQLDADSAPEILVTRSGLQEGPTYVGTTPQAWGSVVVIDPTASGFTVLDAGGASFNLTNTPMLLSQSLAGNGPKHISYAKIDGLVYLSVVNERTYDGTGSPTQDVSIVRQTALNSLVFTKVTSLNVSTPFVAANVVTTAFGNFDGVGQPEIAVAESTLGRVEFFTAAGVKKMTPLTGLTKPTHVLAGNFVDIGTDIGKDDLVVSEYGNINDVSSQVTLYPQTNGTLSSANKIVTRTESKASYMAAADINNDGYLDLAVATLGSGQVQFLYNTAQGLPSGLPKFQVTTLLTVWDAVPRKASVQQIAFGSFNGDGSKDFAATQFTGGVSLHTSAVTTASFWKGQTVVTAQNKGGALTDKRTFTEQAIAGATTVFPLTKALATPNTAYPLKGERPNTGAINVGQSFTVGSPIETATVFLAGNIRTAPTPLTLSTALVPEAVAFDVSGNGQIEPLDALLVINALNQLTRAPQSVARWDVNSDGVLSPLDALLIINQLNIATSAAGQTIDLATAQTMFQAALDRLMATPALLSSLSQVTVTVADLPAEVLSWVDGNQVTVDINAAGRGWFVDSTPTDDLEFASGRAVTGVDLLSVLAHEIGHLLGIEDLVEGSLDEIMHSTLRAGERRLDADAVDGLLGQLL